MIVENRPGAGGAVGTETVARATPDGTTLLVVSTPFLIDPLLRKLNYDPLRSFAPICNLVSALTIIVVNSARALAVGNRTRAEPLPDVPTVIESGYDDFDIDAWFGAFAPAFTPESAINEVKHLIATALQDSSVKEKLSVQGLFPTLSCGNDFATYLRKQNDAYSRIIAEANIKAD